MMNTIKKFELCVLLAVLFWLSIQCEARCSSRSPNNYTLEAFVEETVENIEEGSSVTLTCRMAYNHQLMPHQRLQWREGGVPVQDSLVNSSIREAVHLRIRNLSHVHYGRYTCHCVNGGADNNTRNPLNSLIAYKPYCSTPMVPYSVELLPPNRASIAVTDCPLSNGSDYRLDANCSNVITTHDQAHEQWLRVDNNYTEIESTGTFNLTQPSDQSKFLRFVNNSLVQIVYTMIEGYKPPIHLIPSSNNAVIVLKTIFSPICAVFGDLNVLCPWSPLGCSLPGVPEDVHVQGYSGIPANFVSCRFSDNTVLNYTTHIYLQDQVCVDASNETVLNEGESFTIRCSSVNNGLILFSIIHIFPNSSTLNITDRATIIEKEAKYTINNVSLSDAGEYRCIAIHENNVDEDYVYLTVLSPYNQIAVTSSAYQPFASASVNASLSISPSSTLSLQIETSVNMQTTAQSLLISTLSKTEFVSTQTNSIDLQSLLSSTPSRTTESVAQVANIVTYSVVPILILSLLLAAAFSVFLTIVCYKHAKNRNQTCGVDENKIYKIEDDDSVDSVSLPSSPTNSVLHLTFPYVNTMSHNMTKISTELFASSWYIPFGQLQVLEEIGSGAFGLVRRAKCMLSSHGDWSTVAVKTVREFSTEEEERDIISELKILQNVGCHPNIVSLLGASIRQGQLLIIVEYCSKGNLLEHLRSKRHDSSPLSVKDQLHMCLQVSRGMEYLAYMKCVHRDLAARNILLSDDDSLKVADFGLARELYHYEYKKCTKGKIPFKWMAPESILDRIYTMKSDVWSFGILMWEIMTLGRSPYASKSAEQLIKDLQHGYRLERPHNCPQQVYELMRECWSQTPFARPSFSQLCKVLETMIAGDWKTVTQHSVSSYEERENIESSAEEIVLNSSKNGDTLSSLGGYCPQEKLSQKPFFSSAPYLSVQSSSYLEIIPNESCKTSSCPTNLHILSLQSHPYTTSSKNSLCCACFQEIHKYTNVLVLPADQSTISLCSACELLENERNKEVQEDKEFGAENGKERNSCHLTSIGRDLSEQTDSADWLLDSSQPRVWRTHLKTFRTDSNDSGIRMCVNSGESWSEFDDSGSVFVSTDV